MSESGTDVYIGLDLGTSGLKGVALAPEGTVIARGGAAYPTHRPSPGACEQAPQSWLTAVESVAAQLRNAAQPRRWRGIGLSAMIPTLVTAEPGGGPPVPRSRGRTAGPTPAASSCVNAAVASGCTGPPASGWTAVTCSRCSCGWPTTSRPGPRG